MTPESPVMIVDAPPASTTPVTIVDARPSWGPVQPEERIALIDVLRGLALFGIIAANMRGFAGPLQAYFRPSLVWTTPSDFWTQAFVDTFIQGKFITLFAFLFGVGFTLQFTRAEARGAKFGGTYRRRSFGLILIGLLHQVLFWWGDILVSYGLGGLVLMLFRKCRSKTVLIWALSLIIFPAAGAASFVLFRQIKPAPARKVVQQQMRAQARQLQVKDDVRRTIDVYQHGSFAKILLARIPELAAEDGNQPGVVMYTLPLFLFGLLVYRRGIFQDPAAHRDELKKAMILGLAIGIPMNVGATWIQTILDARPPLGEPNDAMVALVALRLFGRPILSMGYAAAIGLLFLNASWRRLMMPFNVIGRTALSNYLLQTIVCTTIFYSYGTGLYGQVHLLPLFVLSIVIYLLQVPLSAWWLKHYRFGPAEWFWRTMTYGKPPQMKRLPELAV